MLNEKIRNAMNTQLNAEYFSAYLYLAMSAYCDQEGFKGFANWLRVQAQEELAHGTHLFEHILERGAAPVLTEIKAPPSRFASLREMFDLILKHEQHVTERINHIASLAMQETDHASYQFIQWYISEQVEEEASAGQILQQLTFIGDNAAMLYTLDAALSARTFADPFAASPAALE